MPEPTSRTIIITGAGAGVGRALTIGLVSLGHHVVALGRGAPGLEETKAACQGVGTVECHVVDVSDASTLESLFRQIVHQRGGVDLLINGAAVYPREVLSAMAPETWAAGVATNLSGVAYGCRAAVRTFPKNRSAVILNVGSFAYLGPEPASTLYCATKAAVSAFTRSFAVELAFTGSSLIVNEWVPGVYRTRMSGNTGENPALAFERLMTVWEMSKRGSGGRTFERSAEVVPRQSLRSRLKSLLTGHRT